LVAHFAGELHVGGRRLDLRGSTCGDRLDPIDERQSIARWFAWRDDRKGFLERAVGGAIEALRGDPLRIAQAHARRRLQDVVALAIAWRRRRGHLCSALGTAIERLRGELLHIAQG
jgi:hypothetical protein